MQSLSLATLVPTTARLVVISPHLDDGVLSCGDLLADHPGGVVITAFAGRPSPYPSLTSWDERGGFAPGADVVGARRREDERALTVLGGRPLWLDFPDPQYGTGTSQADLADALATALARTSPEFVAMPLGLFHDDHIAASDAAIDAVRRRPGLVGLVYADAIYRPLPDLLDHRLRALADAGFVLREVCVPRGVASDRKRRAVACYASQVRALACSWESGVADAFEPERYWQIAMPAASATAPGRWAAEGGPDGDGC